MDLTKSKEVVASNAARYSVGLLIFSGMVAITLGSLFPSHPRVVMVCDTVGLSVIITTVVTRLLHRRFEDQIKQSFSIINGTQGAGICSVYRDRAEAAVEINKQMASANTCVDIMAIAGSDFLLPKCEVLKRLEHWLRSNTRPKVRVLLLDPRSRHTIERCLIEEGKKVANFQTQNFYYHERGLCQDILSSLKALEDEMRFARARKIPDADLQVRTYIVSPFLMSVRIDDRVFVEMYHCGVTTDELSVQFRKCVGKMVPVLETSSLSKTGQVVGSHFEYVWELSSEREFKPGCLRKLQESLRNRDWLGNFLDAFKRENEDLRVVPPDAAVADPPEARAATAS